MKKLGESLAYALLLAFMFLSSVAANAAAITTTHTVFVDSDGSTTTGCSVGSPVALAGIDQVLRTTVTIDGNTATVTRVELQQCVGTAFAPATVIDAGGWPAGLTADGHLTIETHLPYSTFGGSLPRLMKLGFSSSLGSSTSVLAATPATEAVYPPAITPERRRAVSPGGPARTITLDGRDSDWTGLGMLASAADAANSPVRLTGVNAFGDGHDLFFLFKATVNRGAPVATDDTYSVRQGQTLVIPAPGVLGNDSAGSGTALKASLLTTTLFGPLALSPDGSFIYGNDGTTSGSDSFQYSASNGSDASATAKVTINVTPGLPPLAVADSYTVVRGKTLTVPPPGVLSNDSDPEGFPISAALISSPSHGVVSMTSDGGFTYTHDDSNTTSDQFSYQARDGNLASPTVSVTLTILPRNHAPSFQGGPDLTVLDTAGAQSIANWATAISAGPADEAGQLLNFIVTNDNNSLFAVQPAITPTGTLAFTPAVGQFGDANVTVVLHDNGGTANGGTDTSAPRTFVIHIDKIPVITSANSTTFTVGQAGSFAVTTSARPRASIAESGSLPAGITFVDSGNGSGILSGTPAPGTGGVRSISFTATNAHGSSAPQAFTLTINEAPAITSAAAATFVAGTAGSFTVTTTGFPSNVALAISGALPSGVSFTDNGNGTATFAGTPAATSGGVYPISISGNNGVAPNASQSFTLTVRQAPAFSSAASTTFSTGVAGSFTVTTTGFPAPSIIRGGVALPAGVSFVDNGNGTATLSGTPAAATGGTYAITFTANNGTGAAATQNFVLAVNQPPAITSANAVTFTTGVAGSFLVTSSGFPATVALSESGALPAGLSFVDNGNGTATIAGTPGGGSGGVYPITISGTNGVAPNAAQSFTLTVTQPPAITSTNATTFGVGVAGTFTITATGFPAPALALGGVALPSGVTFTDNGNGTATLGGTPASATGGTYAITFTANNGVGSAASQNFTLTINQPPAITSANATTFTAGAAGSFTVTTSGFPANVALSESGGLPAGVTFVDNGNGTATIAGTPNAGTGGVYPITISGSNGVAPNAAQTFTITVDEAPSITSANVATFTVGANGSFTITTTGFPTPAITRGGVALPSGVTFTDNGNGTATLSGTAGSSTGGTYAISFTASNGIGAAATQNFTLTVNQAPAITSANVTTFTTGAAGTFSVTTSGFPVNVALSESGALPAGVTFVDNGNGTATIAGTPNAGTGGTYSITITGNNGVAPNASQSFVLTVDQAPGITSAGNVTFTAGASGSFTITTTGFPAPAITRGGVALPSGVTFTDNGNGTATLSGTPAAATGGTYAITFTANNGIGPAANQNFTLTINQAPAITSANATTFTTGAAGTFSVTTSGFPVNVALSETGALPAGVTFTDNGNGTATLAGTPNAGTGGTYAITISGSNGVAPNASQNFVLTVDQAPAITSANATTFTAGSSGSFTVTTSGFPTNVALSRTGALPAGVAFVDNGNGTATLSGTPNSGTGGTYSITIAGNNGVAPNASQSFTLTVNQAPAITSANAMTFTTGAPGSFSVTTSGFPVNVALSETGALPAGVTFTDNGNGTATLAGTPNAGTGGTYAITITGNNGVAPNASQNFVLTVDQAPAITSASNATFTVGSSGSFTITTTGFPAPPITHGGAALPFGVTFTDNGNGTATLSGTPAAGTAGTYAITLTANNGIGSPATQNFTLFVNQAPAITSANNATFTAGTAGSFIVTTSGFPPIVVLSMSGTLPAGVFFGDNGDGTATIGGTPNAGTGGTYAITITGTNGVAPNATQNFTLTVNQAPAITSVDHATFTAGTGGSLTITTTGFPTPAITVGGMPLPSGVTFTDNGDGTATLGGIPAAATGGVYAITLTANNGVAPAANQTFTLTIDQPPAITSASSTAFTAGTAGSFTVTTSGFPSSVALSESGALPAGVTFVDNGNGTATIAGTPNTGTGGTYAITISGINGVAPNASQNFVLTIDQAPSITSGNATTFTIGSSGSFTVTASGFPAPTFSESGALPAGVTFNGTTGVLSGTPANGTDGPYSISFTATNGVTPDSTQSFTLTVQPAFVVVSTSPADGTTAVARNASVSVTFNRAAQLSSITTNTASTSCSGSLQLSSDNFATCVQMTAAPAASNGNATFTITPASPLNGSTTYVLRVTTGALDSTGNPMLASYTQPSGFTTLAALAVTSTSPADAATGVALNTPVAVTFNIAANPATITTNTSNTSCSGTLQLSSDNFATCVQMSGAPVASGGNTIFTVTPAAALAGSTIYKIRVTTGAQDASGVSLPSAFVQPTGFTTQPALAVSSTLPADSAGSVAQNTTVAVVFNKAADPATITANTASTACSGSLQLSADNFATCVQMAGAPAASSGNTTFTVTPAGPLNGSTNYKIRVTTGAQDAAGVSLASAFTQTNGFTTQVPIGVSSTSPADGATGVPTSTSVSVTFNQPATASSVTTNVGSTTCSGTLQLSSDNFATCVSMSAAPVASNGNATFTVTPAAALTQSATYKIRVTTGVLDASGVALASTYTQTTGFNGNQAPAITSANTAPFQVGQAGTFTITTTGTPSGASMVISRSGTLPANLTFTNNGDGTATIAGTPNSGTAGAYPLTITASNGVAPDATQSLTVNVNQAPSITSGTSTTFAPGKSGQTFTVTTTGFPTNASMSITQTGTVPSGVTFTNNNDGTATIAGTPASGTATGSPYSWTITANNGVAPNATQSFTLTITCPTITVSGTIGNQTYGVAMSAATFSQTGGNGSIAWSATGLPGGLSINSSTGQVTGAPTATGSFTATITATDAGGCSGTKSVTFSVAPNLTTKSYSTAGNTQIAAGVTVTTPALNASSLSTGDSADVSITYAVTVAPTHGALSLNASGTFLYTPAVGNSTADSFSYTGTANGISVTKTASISFSGMVWYVDSGTASATNDGRSNTPFKTMTAVGAAATAAGDYIYVSKGSGTTTGNYTLKTSQKLVGAGATLNVPSVSPVLTISGSSTNTPTLGGTLTLASSVSLSGFNMSTGSLPALTNGGATVNGISVNIGTVLTTTGTPVTISGTSNGTTTANSMAFTAISSGSGAANAIFLANYTGTFTVNGDGSASNNGSGGTVTSPTGVAVSVSGGSTNITLNQMNLTMGSTLASALSATGSSALTLNRCNISHTGTSTSVDAVTLTNVTGTVSITNSSITGSPHNAINFHNTSTNLSSFTMTGTTVSNNNASSGNDGLLFLADGTTSIPTVTITSCTFSGLAATGVQIQTDNSAVLGNVTLQTSTIKNNNIGVDFDQASSSQFTFNVLNNSTVTGHHSHAFNFFESTTSIGGVFVGKISGNTIGTSGSIDSGSAIGDGIRIALNGLASARFTVTANSIFEVPNASPIDIITQGGTGSAASFKVTNNNMPKPSGTAQTICGGAPCPLATLSIIADSGSNGCLSITGNTAYDSNVFANGFRGAYYFEVRTGPPTGAQLRLEGSTALSFLQNIQSNNTIVNLTASPAITVTGSTAVVASGTCGSFP